MSVAEVKTRVVGQVAHTTLGLTVLVSLGGLSCALLQGWPLWAVGIATVLAWLPMFTVDIARVMRAYQWLALFYVLVVTQTGHFLEHVAQMIQVDILALTGLDARGIFGTLDVEWVHFVWNIWVLMPWRCFCSGIQATDGCGLRVFSAPGTRSSTRTSLRCL